MEPQLMEDSQRFVSLLLVRIRSHISGETDSGRSMSWWGAHSPASASRTHDDNPPSLRVFSRHAESESVSSSTGWLSNRRSAHLFENNLARASISIGVVCGVARRSLWSVKAFLTVRSGGPGRALLIKENWAVSLRGTRPNHGWVTLLSLIQPIRQSDAKSFNKAREHSTPECRATLRTLRINRVSSGESALGRSDRVEAWSAALRARTAASNLSLGGSRLQTGSLPRTPTAALSEPCLEIPGELRPEDDADNPPRETEGGLAEFEGADRSSIGLFRLPPSWSPGDQQRKLRINRLMTRYNSFRTSFGGEVSETHSS
jgi:hypothetical protein